MQSTSLDVGDDCHGLIHVVESAEKNMFGLAVHVAQRVGKLVKKLKGLFGKVNPDVARITNGREHVAQRVEAAFFMVQLGHIADT